MIRRIGALFIKDLKDAVRDARVLIALLLPLGIGIFYNLTLNDDDLNEVRAEVAIYAEGETELPARIQEQLAGLATVEFGSLPDEAAVEQVVADEEYSIGLIVPADFDELVRTGTGAQLRVIRSPSTSIGGDYVLAALEPALRVMSGDEFPVQLDVVQAAEAEPESVLEQLGLRTWSLAVAIMMMVGLVAVLAVPIVLAEEFEKKTIDALILAMPYREVIMAKAALGLFYIAVSTVVFLVITQLTVYGWGWFVAGVALAGLASIAFGLLLAGMFRNANQLNTWSGVFLAPFLGPAVIIGQPVPDWLETAAGLLPTGAGMKLVLKGVSEEPLYSSAGGAVAILLLWTVLAYAVLLWHLKRREA